MRLPHDGEGINRKNDSPVNFPVFLKCYCFTRDGRDILDNKALLSTDWGARIAPIVGINIFDNPLKNFYLGLSLEALPGVDIVGGAHFSKITQLAGGFADGQSVAPGTVAPQTEKFLTGGFVGINVDIGIIGSWLGGSITNTIRGGFK